jgi:plasmid stabilization system protein ParE
MPRTIRFHPEARVEVLGASQSAGSRFVEVLDEAVTQISLKPYVWPTWPGREDVRRRVLKRWPYSVMYTVDAESVFVVAVAHQKRRPGYWLSRF